MSSISRSEYGGRIERNSPQAVHETIDPHFGDVAHRSGPGRSPQDPGSGPESHEVTTRPSSNTVRNILGRNTLYSLVDLENLIQDMCDFFSDLVSDGR